MPDSLCNRMKSNYENRARYYLVRRMPVIIRVDGRAFHTFTRKMQRPFDDKLMGSMLLSATTVAGEMSGFKLGYVQSDEASFLLTDYDNLGTQAWFDYNKSKLESITASIMTAAFARCMRLAGINDLAFFDARAFNIPKEEVTNYFLWRAQDWARNSVSMYAQANFSHAQLQGKRVSDMHDMLFSIGKNWNDLTDEEKCGTFIKRDLQYTYCQPRYQKIDAMIQEAGIYNE